MKLFLVLVLTVAALFLWQRHGNETASAPSSQSGASSSTESVTPRPVSAQNWAKHSLDRTREVMSQVEQTRDQNEQH